MIQPHPSEEKCLYKENVIQLLSMLKFLLYAFEAANV